MQSLDIDMLKFKDLEIKRLKAELKEMKESFESLELRLKSKECLYAAHEVIANSCWDSYERIKDENNYLKALVSKAYPERNETKGKILQFHNYKSIMKLAGG